MRDPERIDKVLEVVAHYWKQHPDMRLGQMLLNVARDPELYYMEDRDLALRVIGAYETGAGDREATKAWIREMTGCDIRFPDEGNANKD